MNLYGHQRRIYALAAVCISILGVSGFLAFYKAPIKVGILHSLTGPLAISEKPMVDAELMAIEEINAQGGIKGRKIKPVVVDGKSDERIFAQEAERLITQEKVVMLIGGWTSASCRAVQPISEKYSTLFIYPVTYEGITESPTIFYSGPTQNQQIVPAALWSYYNLGKTFFLVGSDEIFSHMTNEIVTTVLASVDAKIVGQAYVPLTQTDFDAVVQKIIAAKPQVILNTIQGESNISFFSSLRKNGITPEKIPVMSIASVSETELTGIGTNASSGDYAIASYFQSIDREENSIFVANFKKRFGQNRVVSEAVESAYVSLYLWSQAAANAENLELPALKEKLYNTVFNGPESIIYVDNKKLNIWKTMYIGKLRADSQFTIIWNSKKPIEPVSTPFLKTHHEWQTRIDDLYKQWGNRWSKVS